MRNAKYTFWRDRPDTFSPSLPLSASSSSAGYFFTFSASFSFFFSFQDLPQRGPEPSKRVPGTAKRPPADAGPLGAAQRARTRIPIGHSPPAAPLGAATFPPLPQSVAGVPQGPRKPLFRAPCPRGAQLAGGLPPPPTYCGLTVHHAAGPFESRRDPATAP